jgi:glucose-1-phosphate adenylyltransferase
VLTQFNTASLHKHIQQAYGFDPFSRGFVDILAAEQTMEKDAWYQGTADAVRQNMHHFNLEDDSLIIILSGDQLYRMDLSQFVDQHRRTGADLTISAKAMPRDQVAGLGVMRVNPDSSIIEFVEKPTDPKVVDSLVVGGEIRASIKDPSDTQYCLASMGIYVFSGKVLKEALKNNMKDFGKEVIPALLGDKKIFSYVFDGYWEDIGTVGSFWETNLALTDPVPPFNFFDSEHPIYTHARFLPPAKLNSGCVKNVVLSEGCIVTDAELRRCVVGVRSVVREGSRMHEVVMMGADFYEELEELEENKRLGRPNLGVGFGSIIHNAIIDKNARIGNDVRLSPFGVEEKWETEAMYVRDGVLIIKKNAIIPDGTVVGTIC